MNLVEIPKYVDRTIHISYPRKIPYIFMQNSAENLLTPSLAKNIFDFMEGNSEYTYMFFDDKDSREFISKNFPEEVLNAFDDLSPGAYKSDLFRYCFMYIVGGVYLDVNKKMMVDLNDFIDRDYDFVSCIDRDIGDGFSIWQAILASPPKTQLMAACIKGVVNNVKNRYYGPPSALGPTGPLLVGKVFKKIYGVEFSKPGVYTVKGDLVKFIINDPAGDKTWDADKNIITYTNKKVKNIQQEMWNNKQKLYYYDLFAAHKIYNSEINFIKNDLLFSSSINIGILVLLAIFIGLYCAKQGVITKSVPVS